MKYAYISTISPGYMFALNSTINANFAFGTNADFHLLYEGMEPEYMEKFKNLFPFEVRWYQIENHSDGFHNAKYKHVCKIADEYDAVCLIDADEFICCNTKEYFERVSKNDLLITSTHAWSQFPIHNLFEMDVDKVVDRCYASLADFPVFVNPKTFKEMFHYWHINTNKDYVNYGIEINHPLVVFNRAVRKFLREDQIETLDGEQWICDSSFWRLDYKVIDGRMNNGKDVGGIHNKWWKWGASSGEWLASQQTLSKLDEKDKVEIMANMDRGERNMNNIKEYMETFNNLIQETKRDDYNKEKINWRNYLRSQNLSF